MSQQLRQRSIPWDLQEAVGLGVADQSERERCPNEIVVYLDEPEYNTWVAATPIGSTNDALKKMRQRGTGPDYIQEREGGGTVSYRLSSLLHYAATHPPNRGTAQHSNGCRPADR